MRFRWKFDRYPVPNSTGTAQEAQFGDWVAGSTGDQSVFGAVVDGRVDPTAPFLVSLVYQRHWFVPGEYTLRVQTEENRGANQVLGTRVSTRVVRFTIVEGWPKFPSWGVRSGCHETTATGGEVRAHRDGVEPDPDPLLAHPRRYRKGRPSR